jgi:hypothetical protein
MTSNEANSNINYVALLAIELHQAGCHAAVVQLCNDLPPTTDIRIHVALKALATKSANHRDLVDPSAVIANFEARFADASPPSSEELLQQVLAVLSSPRATDSQHVPQQNPQPSLPAPDRHWADLPPPPLSNASRPSDDEVREAKEFEEPKQKLTVSPRKKVSRVLVLVGATILTVVVLVNIFASGNTDDTQAPNQQSSTPPSTITSVTSPPTTQPNQTTSTTNLPPTRPSSPSTALATTTTTSTLPPPLIHQEISGHPYFAALVGFSFEDALLMQRNSAYGSPAWAYGRHLAQGFRADSRTANATTQIRESATAQAEFCINSSCFAIDGVVPIPTQIFDFSLGGRKLSETTRGWEGNGPQQCAGRSQFCVPDESIIVELTSIHQVGSTSFVTIEISSGSSLGLRVEHVATSVVGPLGRIPAAVQVGGRINSGQAGVWLYRFSETPLNAISALEVTTVSDGQEFLWRLDR